MNKSLLFFFLELSVTVSCLSYERSSDYSFIGMDSLTNYAGYSYWTPKIQHEKGVLYNSTLLGEVLSNLELSAMRRNEQRSQVELSRLRHLLAYVSLDDKFSHRDRVECVREICYLFLRLADRGQIFFSPDIRDVFPHDFITRLDTYQAKRHLTFLNMVSLAISIYTYQRANGGKMPTKLQELATVTKDINTLDVWSHPIEYEAKGNTWLLYSRGPRNENRIYDFDCYIPAIELGVGTVNTWGIYLSSSFTEKRIQLFRDRSIEYRVNGRHFRLFLDRFNHLHDSESTVKQFETKIHNCTQFQLNKELGLKIANDIFVERYGKSILECHPWNITEHGMSYVITGRKKTSAGEIVFLEIDKSDGTVLRCCKMKRRTNE